MPPWDPIGPGNNRACYHPRVTLGANLLSICEHYGIDALYAFGSRADEIAALVQGDVASVSRGAADVDLGVLPRRGSLLDGDNRVTLTMALEDLLDVPRVDLIVLPEAGPFLALDIVSGELVCCANPIREAEYQLYVLRRAGDLAYFERERRRTLLAGIAP